MKPCCLLLLPLLALTLTVQPTPAPAADLVAPAKVDALAQELIESGWVHGLAIGLINEQGTQTVGYGHVSGANSLAPDAETVFEIGSITKVFTGLVLAQMVEERSLGLEDPVQKLLGDSIRIPPGKSREITLVDLSSHSSGLPSMPSNFKPKDARDPFADYTVEQLAEFLGKHTLDRQLGERYEYSNLAVGLLGHALAAKDGVSYEDMVRRRICEPLSLRDTRITLDDALRARLAEGHDFDGNPASNWSLPTLAGAGALRSTVHDMLTFLSAQLGFTKTPFDKTIAASHVVRFKLPDGSGVALGWHLRTDGTIWHNGGTGGYHSFAGFLPGKKIGVAVLANTQVSAIDTLGQRLLDLLATGDAQPIKLARPIKLDQSVLDGLVGSYSIPLVGKLLVTRDGDHLVLDEFGQAKMRLYAESATKFRVRAPVPLIVAFELDESGRPAAVLLDEAGHKTRAPRDVK